jgi:hypothetical protein
MIGAVIENLTAGYLRPRTSVRRLLSGGHGLGDALMMVALAYLIGSILTIMVPGGAPATAGVPIGLHLLGLLLQFISFFIASGLVFLIGRMFGGQGTRQETYLTMAWYSLVTSLIVPLTLPARNQLTEAVAAAGGGQAEVPLGAPILLFAAAFGIMLWLLSNYIAELHRFRSAWGVLAVILGFSAALSVIIMMIIPPS